MSKLFIHAMALPEYADEIPGVWRNRKGSGGRIPLNALTILGINNGRGSARRLIEMNSILNSIAFYPWVRDMLLPYQKEIISSALSKDGYHAWAPPGSGKTLCGLVWIAQAASRPKLVITKAAARGTWKEEIRKYTRFTPQILSGKTAVGRIPYDPKCIYITAWETLISWKDALINLDPHSVVMDEIHWAKNHKRVKPIMQESGQCRFDPLDNTAYAISEISKVAARRLGMTATPVPNRTRDLWAQLDLIEPWQWGTFHKFGERYCDGFKDAYGWKYDGLSNEDELLRRLDWCRTKTDQTAVSLNLPPKRRQIIYLERSEQNRPSAFKRAISQAGKTGDRESVFEVMLQEAASRKKKYVVERVVEAVKCGQKVVVFTGRRLDCERLGEAISKATDVDVWCAHGGSSTDMRDHIRHEYMLADVGVLVGTGDAWGESVNLQDTDLALFVMLPWTPRAIRQWEGRFSRLGQKRPVLVSYIISKGTVDEHVADILLDKLPAVGKVAEDETMEELEQAFDANEEDLLARVAGQDSP
tara:strand:+ start:5611 stop:7203 length:1593 start_codon:yes stop_codon:yes gene_type:complete